MQLLLKNVLMEWLTVFDGLAGSFLSLEKPVECTLAQRASIVLGMCPQNAAFSTKHSTIALALIAHSDRTMSFFVGHSPELDIVTSSKSKLSDDASDSAQQGILLPPLPTSQEERRQSFRAVPDIDLWCRRTHSHF